MSERPHQDPQPQQPDSDDSSLDTRGEPKEIIRHALGPKEVVGGSPVDNAEERRREIALKHKAEVLARLHGLKAHESHPFPADAPKAPLAAEISRVAPPLMAQADAGAMVTYETVRRTYADGSSEEGKRVQVNIFAPLANALKSIAELLRTTIKGKASLNLKVGKQGLELQAKAKGSQD